MIAMALACRPKLLIADEPTTALDVTIQAQILKLLDDLQAEMGMALLYITHDLNLVRRFSHRVGVMERGRLVESGDTAVVFADPQHAYTRRLLASRPQRVVRPVAHDAPMLAQGRGGASHVPDSRAAGSGRRSSPPSGAPRSSCGAARRWASSASRGRARRRSAWRCWRCSRSTAVRWSSTAQRIDNAERDLLRAMRRRMQVVFQDPYGSLSPRMTVGQIVGEGLGLHRPELPPAERERLVLEMLDEVGLSERHGVAGVLQRYPHEFSGGQRQRIAIARAVVLGPDVLVLDEPTSALDVSVQQQVLKLLADLQQRRGLSFVFISHDLAVVRAMSHRVLVMKDGDVVEEGEAEALFASPQAPYTRALLAAAHLA